MSPSTRRRRGRGGGRGGLCVQQSLQGFRASSQAGCHAPDFYLEEKRQVGGERSHFTESSIRGDPMHPACPAATVCGFHGNPVHPACPAATPCGSPAGARPLSPLPGTLATQRRASWVLAYREGGRAAAPPRGQRRRSRAADRTSSSLTACLGS